MNQEETDVRPDQTAEPQGSSPQTDLEETEGTLSPVLGETDEAAAATEETDAQSAGQTA